MGLDAVGWRALALALGLAVALAACDDVREGCLDYRALTIDIYAEEACDDCCTYPRLILQQLPGRVVGNVTRRIAADTPLVRRNGDTVRLTALVYFLHDLEIEFEDGRVYPLADTFSFRQNTSANFEFQRRSLLRAAPLRRAQIATGQLLEEGRVVALRAKFGLPGEYSAGQPDAQTTGLPLGLGQDSLLFDFSPGRLGGYRSAYVRTLTADGRADSTWVSGPASVPLRYALPTITDLDRAYNLNLTLLLPVSPLVDLPGGAVSADEFVASFLSRAQIVSVSVSR